MSVNLTKKQVEVLEYIENFISQTGYSPTYREIQAGLGYKSVATVSKHIDNLIILGKLEKADNGEARSLSLCAKNRSEIDDTDKFVLNFMKKKRNEFSRRGDFATARKIDEVLAEIWPK